jgi:hypothetical protein
MSAFTDLIKGPKAPNVQATPAPSQAETDAQIAAREQTRQLSLTRYLSGLSQLGANELRGDTTGGTGLRP